MTPIKTATFAITHMTVAFGVVYVMTGDPLLGGAVALIEPLVNTVAYFFHERIWERFLNRLPRAVRAGALRAQAAGVR